MVALQTTFLACALLGAGNAELLDFHADWCGPCREMTPIVDQLTALGYPVRKVNIDQNRELAARYKVTSIPCFVLVVDGQEAGRTVGVASSERLKSMFRNAGVGPGGTLAQAGASSTFADPMNAGGAIARAQSPDPAPLPRGIPLAAQPSAAPMAETQAHPLANQSMPAGPAAHANVAQLVAASVRIRIEDSTGHSYGTGTIIDRNGDQALVLTCGHIFRDSAGKGQITVDLFGPGAPQGLPAQLVGYDETNDVGLICFRPNTNVTVARVAPPTSRVGANDRVTSVGCDNGTEPTARQSHVTSIGKYLGPPNIEVAGQPVQGRSGGGLFNEAGQVIGVCNAADPADDEGLFAALTSIHSLLEQSGLAAVYQTPATPANADNESFVGPLVDVRAPQMPEQMPRNMHPMPLTNDRENNLAGPIGSPSAMPVADMAQPLAQPGAPQAFSRQEASALAAAQASGAEVVCIIRSLNDPQAKSQVVRLDQASPAFLELLAAEQRRQSGRQTTSLAVSNPNAVQQRRATPPAAAKWRAGQRFADKPHALDRSAGTIAADGWHVTNEVMRAARKARFDERDERKLPMQQSAGTLLYRVDRSAPTGQRVSVLLVHPSGNYNRRAPWSIPKGLPDEGEALEAAARRETLEETGVVAGALIPLGEITYRKSRKRVHCFVGPAPADAAPRCASWEVDRAEFVSLDEARRLIHPDQLPFLDRLVALIAGETDAPAS